MEDTHIIEDTYFSNLKDAFLGRKPPPVLVHILEESTGRKPNQPGGDVLERKIKSQVQTIRGLSRTIEKQQQAIKQSSKSKQLIAAVSFVVGGILASGGTSFYGQIAPESGVQSFVSSLAKKFTDGKTGYDLIQEGKNNILVIQKQSTEQAVCQQIISQQRETLLYDGKLIKTLGEALKIQTDLCKISMDILASEKATEKKMLPDDKTRDIGIQGVTKSIKKTEPITDIEKTNDIDTTFIFSTLSNLRNQISQELPSGMKMQIQEQSGGRVLVWIENNGQKSLGFFADNPRFKSRLTKEGIRQWMQSVLGQFSATEQINQITAAKNIGLSGSPISMRTKKEYDGSIILLLSDVVSKKSGRLVVDPKKDTKEDIEGKIDMILVDFFSE